MAVYPELPIEGIDFLMGNDIVGGKVTPLRAKLGLVTNKHAGRYSACVVTRAQAPKKKHTKMAESDVSLSESLLMSIFSDQAEKCSAAGTCDDGVSEPMRTSPDPLVGDRPPPLPVSRTHLCEMQRADPTRKECFLKVVSNSNATGERVAYYVEDNLLMCRWPPL